MRCNNQDPHDDASVRALRAISVAAHGRLQGETRDRWGVWCRPKEPYTREACGGRLIPAMFAEGPAGELVLYETVAKHLAAHWNEILPTYEHEARQLDDPGEPNPEEYEDE